ncbi:MAG: protein translocase subunit SecF [Candidatus Buchananbacteria bacterium]|nr:protein translocase subunit SecF [Candidatus Buchananbacteria bacterium]
MKIINKRKIFFTISSVIVLTSILIWIAWGLNLGIDFTGGSLLEVKYKEQGPDIEQVKQSLADLNLEGLNIQPTGENGYILRFKEISEETHQQILNRLNNVEDKDEQRKSDLEESEENIEITTDAENSTMELEAEAVTVSGSEDKVIEQRFEAIGPSIGQELKSKSIWAILLVLIAIVFYIAWAFRKVSYPVSSWKYGIIAIITLFHDILITLGIFIFLGKYLGLEVNTPFVAALLTILGYSVNDTIVVFDRIRENLHKYEGEFEEIVDKSVRETITRSINTSLTTELVLLAILIFGGTTISDFVLVLVTGILLGAYSSIFIAAPLLVVWQKLDWRLKKS